ncbi:MAG: ribose-phosphate pyrophosphokinase [Oscillospiraceae bacterium]|nr:ribose-phosphate pyrophosphokinase [Oscillospiraceae bacterium]
MISINGIKAELGSFPDGTMLIKQAPPAEEEVKISWYYENDRELVALIYLANHMKAHGHGNIHLYMPYIPNARQDRVKGAEDVFTLKYFANVINGLGFKTVTVLDPHSSVSEALIDNIVIQKPQGLIESVIDRITKLEGEQPSMFYPDEGAGKRYSGMIPLPYAFGIKKRDWKTGQIQGLEVSGDTGNIAGKNILIVDDICSKGGTFYFSAKRLKELGAGNIYLYITHCENSIMEGEVLTSGLIKRVFTTNSILTKEHEKIELISLQ